MTTATILAVSPHLDDAVLSYGGRLAQLCARGDRVVIYTVFAGLPDPEYSLVARWCHRLWGLSDDAVQARREEDRLAAKILGAVPVHGTFLDSIYRRDARGDWLIGLGGVDKGGRLGPEPTLVARIAEAIERQISDTGPSLMITCAATGDHVDHARTRSAMLMAAMRTGTPVRFWEDLPYGIGTDYIPSLPAGAALAGSHVEPVDAEAWQAKVEAVGCYVSQQKMLADSSGSITERLDAHALARGRSRASQGRGELAWDVELGRGQRNSRPSNLPDLRHRSM
jgi:LmbE family N-acetylglucosaminyl deacetylase